MILDQTATELRGALDVLMQIPYGVYIVSTGGDSLETGAFAATWVTQVSFDPLLLAIAVGKTSGSHALLTVNGIFAINLLDQTQTLIAARLGTPSKYSPHKINTTSWVKGATGVPVLRDAAGYLECILTQQLDPEGDHTLFIGQVVTGKVNRREPILTLERSGLRYR
jgi:flavin reductase (DIM6/NTAB) family NADH-FMN oxidoreductase RutF